MLYPDHIREKIRAVGMGLEASTPAGLTGHVVSGSGGQAGTAPGAESHQQPPTSTATSGGKSASPGMCEKSRAADIVFAIGFR